MSKKRIKWSIITSAILYLTVAFIKWDITFILKAGEWHPIDRFSSIFILLGKELLVYLATDAENN